MSRLKPMTASLAAAATIAAGGALAITATPASAADVYTVDNNRIIVVDLNHAETVTAADIGAGNVINAILGNDHWSVGLHPESKYQADRYYRPDKATTWNNVTGQQVIAEAAANPRGHVTLAVAVDYPDNPLWVIQDW